MAKLVQSQLKPRKMENPVATAQGLSFPPNIHSTVSANMNKPQVYIPQNAHSAMGPSSGPNLNMSQAFPPNMQGSNAGKSAISYHPPSIHTSGPVPSTNLQQTATQMPYHSNVQGPLGNKHSIAYPPIKSSVGAPVRSSSNALPPVPINALALAASATMINSPPIVGYPPIHQKTQVHQSNQQIYPIAGAGTPFMPASTDQSYNGSGGPKSNHHLNATAGFDFDLL